jgi:hypothetical protein
MKDIEISMITKEFPGILDDAQYFVDVFAIMSTPHAIPLHMNHFSPSFSATRA